MICCGSALQGVAIQSWASKELLKISVLVKNKNFVIQTIQLQYFHISVSLLFFIHSHCCDAWLSFCSLSVSVLCYFHLCVSCFLPSFSCLPTNQSISFQIVLADCWWLSGLVLMICHVYCLLLLLLIGFVLLSLSAFMCLIMLWSCMIIVMPFDHA